jgi:hypothetical protein
MNRRGSEKTLLQDHNDFSGVHKELPMQIELQESAASLWAKYLIMSVYS